MTNSNHQQDDILGHAMQAIARLLEDVPETDYTKADRKFAHLVYHSLRKLRDEQRSRDDASAFEDFLLTLPASPRRDAFLPVWYAWPAEQREWALHVFKVWVENKGSGNDTV